MSASEFNPGNLQALLGHLPAGSLAHELVSEAGSRTTAKEASEALGLLLADRLKGVQDRLDGDSAMA